MRQTRSGSRVGPTVRHGDTRLWGLDSGRGRLGTRVDNQQGGGNAPGEEVRPTQMKYETGQTRGFTRELLPASRVFLQPNGGASGPKKKKIYRQFKCFPRLTWNQPIATREQHSVYDVKHKSLFGPWDRFPSLRKHIKAPASRSDGSG